MDQFFGDDPPKKPKPDNIDFNKPKKKDKKAKNKKAKKQEALLKEEKMEQ